jgi:hypothetical protein
VVNNENANQNEIVISPHSSQNGYHGAQTMINAGNNKCRGKGTLVYCWCEH